MKRHGASSKIGAQEPARAGLDLLEYHCAQDSGELLQSQPGTYALLMLSEHQRTTISIGRRGALCLQPGYYIYCGSALGPGGVRARLNHHLHLALRPHWHIDYLRYHVALERIWFTYSSCTQEHRWAESFAQLPGIRIPMAGFGTSDCRCDTHLYFCKRVPTRVSFARLLERKSVGPR